MCPTGTSSPPAADLRSAFEILDVDRDGKISREDLKLFYSDAGDEIIRTMMTVADLNNDGVVEYNEFEKVLRGNKRESVLEEVFNVMDRDGDGKVGYGDLRSYLGLAGIEVDDDDDIDVMVRLGSEDDGVTFDGFCKILAI